MNIQSIQSKAKELLQLSETNRINNRFDAYSAPIIAVAAADDPLFEELCKPGIIGTHFRKPEFWLPDAKSVISIFFPITDAVKESNCAERKDPSSEWLYARYEGQQMINEITRDLAEWIQRNGYHAVAPSLDSRFCAAGPKDRGFGTFNSNWSERHIAYISGHGTFGLSKGLITRSGITGRFSSIITDMLLSPTQRAYTELYEYCNKCGACIGKCPVDAISMESGKAHLPCSDFIDQIQEKYDPRYGCGKCQCGVPCASKIPK